MVEPVLPAVITGLVKPLVEFGLQGFKSKLEKNTSLADRHKALSHGLEWLLALQRGIDEVSSKIPEGKMETEIYRNWTKRVSEVKKEVTSLTEKHENEKTRKGLKEKIRTELTKVVELLENCLEKILAFYKQPEPVIKESRVPSVAEYPTLNTAFQQIKDLLLQGSNNGVKCVVLHGQGGVGKTTIMKNLNNFYYEDNFPFKMVIFIRVAADEQIDERTERHHILRQIAQRIKVDEQGDESQVARRIQTVLEHKIYLLILDGVRHELDLQGIWDTLKISEHENSKVVVTPRYHLPLKAKCVDRAVKLELLSDDEGWTMFMDIVGNNLSPSDIPKARMVRKRFCRCLPMLLHPIASSFKDEEPHIDWQKALREFKSWGKVEGLEEIYSNMEICYKRLKGQSEKKCFLYASLYPANTKIYTRYFVECCIAQGFFGDLDATTKYSKMRRRAMDKLKHLVNVELLKEVEQEALLEEVKQEMKCVRMTVFLRGFALHICKDSEYKIYVDNEKQEEPSGSESWQHTRWVSMVGSEKDCLPSEHNFGSVETLLLQENQKLVRIPQNYFRCMGNLLVLNLYGTKIRKLPDLSELTSLKAFYLNGCSDLYIDFSQIQLPEYLEVFDIRGIRVDSVPRLISLRCLRMLYTPGRNYDAISELHNLEELTIDIEEEFDHLWNPNNGDYLLIKQKVKSLKNLTTFHMKSVSDLKVTI